MDGEPQQKAHRARQSGRKAVKKNVRFKQRNDAKHDKSNDDADDATSSKRTNTDSTRARNPKAFTFQSIKKAAKLAQRGADVTEKKTHIPLVDRTSLEPPPIIVAVVGPSKVGKSTLLRDLVRHYVRQPMSTLTGPITIVTGKQRRVTFVEVRNELTAMLDACKVVDLVLLLIDASYGFEMETFEFLHMCQAHGMPRVIGVLTHIDLITNKERVKRVKKELKHRFWTEVYQGAKLFYLTRVRDDRYLKNEVKNLARFISVMKFRPLTWRSTHAYIVADRFEDLTDADTMANDPQCNRSVCLYGYVRGGANLKGAQQSVHIAGVGDMRISSVAHLEDPCPLPTQLKKRTLNEKERCVYAPMCGLGGIVYDGDAIYIDTQGSHSQQAKPHVLTAEMGARAERRHTVDERIKATPLTVFAHSEQPVLADNRFARTSFTWPCCSDDEMVSENDNDDDDDESVSAGSDWSDLVQSRKQAIDSTTQPPSKRVKTADIDTRGLLQSRLTDRAAQMYTPRTTSSRRRNWMHAVYDNRGAATTDLQVADDDEKDELAGLFHVSLVELARQKRMDDVCDAFDSCCAVPGTSGAAVAQTSVDWSSDEQRKAIIDCFVTGKWTSGEDAFRKESALADDFGSDDAGEFGSLSEDSESGDESMSDEEQQVQTEPSEANAESTLRVVGKTLDDERAEREAKRLAKKRKMKQMFDSEYDETRQHYVQAKTEMSEQAEKNRQAFAHLDTNARVALEGYRAGMYVRVRFDECPVELVNNFDASYLYIIGALLPGEQNIGAVQVRLKRHRWFPRLLKTRDPLIISCGWRRFQSVVLYHTQEHNGRNRLLKYSPEHLFCHAAFWGPITPQNTPFVAVQSVSGDHEKHFRIAATGVIVNLDKSLEIVKKLKLTGYPYEIFKKSAFVRGMFNTQLEVAKFEGAQLRTVSGLRGQLKKALAKSPGAFRATFEDKILMRVPLVEFYAPVCNLLMADKVWAGMKTVGRLRYERKLTVPVKADSLYRPVERRPWVPDPLSIPKNLHKQLPYEYKPKLVPRVPKDDREALIKKHTVVLMEPHESRVHELMKMVRTVADERVVTERADMNTRVRKHKLEQMLAQQKTDTRMKEHTKRICKQLSKREQSVLKRALHDVKKERR